MPNDPWKHRSSGMRCYTCMWFVEKSRAGTGVGRCRRHAPTMSGYPVVLTTDWCGDHKLNEEVVSAKSDGEPKDVALDMSNSAIIERMIEALVNVPGIERLAPISVAFADEVPEDGQ